MVDPNKTKVTRGVHDLGWLSAGPIDREERPLSGFERRVDAMMMLMIGPSGAFRADALRRAIEEYNNQDYNHLGYYDKWVRACAGVGRHESQDWHNRLLHDRFLHNATCGCHAGADRCGRIIPRWWIGK